MTVIVEYEGSYFPGEVLDVKKNHFIVTVMRKSSPKTWKWPDNEDKDKYDISQIIEIIKPPAAFNNRGQFVVPEIEKYWPPI